MRSHVMKAKKEEEKEKKPFFDFQRVHSNSSESSSSSSEEEESGAVKRQLSNYELRQSPKQSTFLMDRESETESSKKNPISRRSKRVRKSRNSDFKRFKVNGFLQSKYENEEKKNTREDSSMAEVEPLSSISDTTPEENVAHCLIMLSKDSWKREEIEYQEEEEEENDYYSEDSDVGKVIKSSKVKGKYKCETCNKFFRSYQALGGHRASHKKIKVNTTPSPPPTEEKIHECPFCQRVFPSGQALGGHKRSHFVNGATKIRPFKGIGEGLDIDLNLPAPIDEDDEISQTTFSAVSDAEFVYPFKES
ncbi:hypothetical protein RD792_015648 [Penstemon davidsonii]|uniref:C2H2-type domain-containing protein n=1 Tax=Penstemon davidsonii TaxID=160366 RepID=A0ABR0CHA2_9LAMI|nr:hypothetical protein RD792_015648 [Penstemon davidsonii]